MLPFSREPRRGRLLEQVVCHRVVLKNSLVFFCPCRGRRAGAGVRGEREPARAAARRREGRGDDAVGAARVGGAAGGAGAGVPARPVRARGGARRRQGVERAPRRGHVRQALRLRVGADGVLRCRPPPVLRAHHARLAGVRRPALHPLRHGDQEERRVQLRRRPPRAPLRQGGLLLRRGPPPHRSHRAETKDRWCRARTAPSRPSRGDPTATGSCDSHEACRILGA